MKTKLTLLLGLLTSAFCLPAQAQGTAFTYQGRLNAGVSPANGRYDLTFALFNVSSGAGQVGSTVTNPATSVSNGLSPSRWISAASFRGRTAGWSWACARMGVARSTSYRRASR